jgi:hypothetical protein
MPLWGPKMDKQRPLAISPVYFFEAYKRPGGWIVAPLCRGVFVSVVFTLIDGGVR